MDTAGRGYGPAAKAVATHGEGSGNTHGECGGLRPTGHGFFAGGEKTGASRSAPKAKAEGDCAREVEYWCSCCCDSEADATWDTRVVIVCCNPLCVSPEFRQGRREGVRGLAVWCGEAHLERSEVAGDGGMVVAEVGPGGGVGEPGEGQVCGRVGSAREQESFSRRDPGGVLRRRREQGGRARERSSDGEKGGARKRQRKSRQRTQKSSAERRKEGEEGQREEAACRTEQRLLVVEVRWLRSRVRLDLVVLRRRQAAQSRGTVTHRVDALLSPAGGGQVTKKQSSTAARRA